jgi:hypothetical protein
LNFEQGIGCFKGSQGLLECECLFDNPLNWFPDFNLLIGGKNYFIPKEEYVYQSEGRCYLLLMEGGTEPVWILGLGSFFPNYYVVFDQENYRIGFAINKHARKSVNLMTEQYKPTKATEEVQISGKPKLNYLLISIIFLVVIALVGKRTIQHNSFVL